MSQKGRYFLAEINKKPPHDTKNKTKKTSQTDDEKISRESSEMTEKEQYKSTDIVEDNDEKNFKVMRDRELKKRKEVDPYPGPAPIPEEKLRAHTRGGGIKNTSDVRTKFFRKKVQQSEKKFKLSVQMMARTERLNQEEVGFLEAEAGEATFQFSQKRIAKAVDITSATKQFDLNLSQYGPYKFDYTLNGRHLVLGGKKGHVSAMDWVTKKLACEINVMESVHGVRYLHVETMFAASQKDHVFIYDNQGVELHCIKKLFRVLAMEFLPYHFLLATASDRGFLTWLDVSIGKFVSHFQTRMGVLDVMCQNPQNAVVHLGHTRGIVTMWTPNNREAVGKMLCHQHPIRSIAIDPSGRYMATSSVDRTLKIWDVRTYKSLHTYKTRSGATSMSYSQRGLLATGMGNVVEVYKDTSNANTPPLYLRHHLARPVTQIQFCPYEDVLGIGHMDGFTSMLVPGAGEPNFDALERNPFQTKKQRREAEVKALLEKIQPEMITLDPNDLGDIDLPTLQERFEAKKALLFVKPQKIDFKPRKSKYKGGSVKTFNVKKGVREELKLRNVKESLKRKQNYLDEHEEIETPKESSAPKSVLDIFKPKQNKRKKVLQNVK